jgi:predicted outer membrane repeat protein
MRIMPLSATLATGVATASAHAGLVGMVVVPSTVAEGTNTLYVFTVYAKFNSPLDTVLNCYGMNATPPGLFWHNDFLSGGIHINLSSPTVEDCVIENCSAPWGGGVIVYRSSAVLRRCTIRNNDASEGAGGLYLFRGYGALVDDCLFEGNEAPEGGAIYCEFGWATLRGSDFFGNRSTAEGSAIRHRDTSPEPAEPPFLTIENCLVRDNESALLGAAAEPTSPRPGSCRWATPAAATSIRAAR